MDRDAAQLPIRQASAKASPDCPGENRRPTPLPQAAEDEGCCFRRHAAAELVERVDTRVLQVIYAFEDEKAPFYVGQQVDVSIDAAKPSDKQ